MSTEAGNADAKTYHIHAGQELRVAVRADASAAFSLRSGEAELFGTELAPDRAYKLSGPCNFGIFSWKGCSVEISGDARAYSSDDVVYKWYANFNQILNERRQDALKARQAGPRVVLVGPTDTGKSTQCRVLLNYAVRCMQFPTFVDTDVGQSSLSVPGVLAAVTARQPIDIEKGMTDLGMPLSLFYGDASPGENMELYLKQVTRLMELVDKRFERHVDLNAAGLLVNTCGWVDEEGYDLLVKTLEIVKADIVLVIDHERLYNDLLGDLQAKNSEIVVLKAPKSSGVTLRSAKERRASRSARVRAYFYGEQGDLCPHTRVLSYGEVSMYRVGGGPMAPSSALPIGAERQVEATSFHEIECSENAQIQQSVVAVSQALSEESLGDECVAGFIYVTGVDDEAQRLTVLAPSAGPLPSKLLVCGNVKWIE